MGGRGFWRGTAFIAALVHGNAKTPRLPHKNLREAIRGVLRWWPEASGIGGRVEPGPSGHGKAHAVHSMWAAIPMEDRWLSAHREARTVRRASRLRRLVSVCGADGVARELTPLRSGPPVPASSPAGCPLWSHGCHTPVT